MSGKSKFWLWWFLISLLIGTIAVVGYYRLGMPFETGAILSIIASVMVDIFLIAMAIMILGFKRLVKWIYASVVVAFVCVTVNYIAALTLVESIVCVGVSVLLVLTLIPLVFKKS